MSMSDSNTVSVQKKESKARRNCFRVWTIIGGIILAIVLGAVMNVLAIPVGIIIWATIIVFILRTPVNKLESWGVNRALGTGIAYVGMFLALGIIGLLMFSPAFGIGDQFVSLAESIPGYVGQLMGWYTELNNQYAGFLQNETVQTWLNEAGNSLGAWASEIAQSSADGIVAVGSAVMSSFMTIGFALVVAFWVLMDLPAIGRESKRFVSDEKHEDVEMLYITFTRVMGGYIKATLVQCILIGVGCGIGFSIIGLPYAAALGGISGLLNIIPVVGPWLGGALAAVVGVFVSPWLALVALAITIVVQQLIYTFVSPKLMADSVDIHPVIVIITLMAGSAVGGAMNGLMGSLVGMLASIPAVAAGKAIFVYYFEKKTGRRIVAEDGVFFKEPSKAIEKEIKESLDEATPPTSAKPEKSDEESQKKDADG